MPDYKDQELDRNTFSSKRHRDDDNKYSPRTKTINENKVTIKQEIKLKRSPQRTKDAKKKEMYLPPPMNQPGMQNEQTAGEIQVKIEKVDDSYDRGHHRGHRREDRGHMNDDRDHSRDNRSHRRDDRGPRRDNRGHRRDDRGHRRDDRGHRSDNEGNRRIKTEDDGSRRNIKRENSANQESNKWGNKNFKKEENPLSDKAKEFGKAIEESKDKKEKEKPNFALSGKLGEETNTYKGVVIKYGEPAEARVPQTRWRLYAFKGEEKLPVLHIHRQSAFLIGRDRRIADIPVDHPSCSKQHAVLQYRLVGYEKANGVRGRRVRPYILDLGSANGTYVNNDRIESEKYVELLEKDLIKFGFSSREYVLLRDDSVDSDLDVGVD